jgi:hypothetical protein
MKFSLYILSLDSTLAIIISQCEKQIQSTNTDVAKLKQADIRNTTSSEAVIILKKFMDSSSKFKW